MNMDGGNIDTSGFFLGQIAGSLATVNMTGGTINTAYSFEIGSYSATLGLLNMTGGTINSDDWFNIGDWGTDGGNGRLNLHGGTINTYNLTMGQFSHMDITEGVLTSDFDLTVPTGWLFDPENDTPGEEYTGTLQRMVEVGRLTAYDVNHGEIITDDVNYPTEVGKRAIVLFDYGLSNPDKTTLTAATVDPNIAWNPKPFDGETGILMPYLSHTGSISWSPGNNAVSHDLYLGTDFDAVNNATPASAEYVRNQSLEDINDTPTLKWGQTYYWRVDEVNGGTTWKGDVWTFAMEDGKALDPNPADDQWWVPIEVVLNWTPGGEAVSHELYFSSDFDEVNDRSISPAVPGANSYDPGMLQLDTTYYWAVDEVNTVAEVNPWPGDVWSFKTENHIFVDNFDSYADDYDMQDVWCDYWCNDDSGAEVVVETTVVYNGKSMDFYYDNSYQTGGYYLGSEIYADTADLDIGSNWTINGAKALWMVFYGQADNSITTNDRMYVAVEDASANIKVIEYPDMNDLQAWQLLPNRSIRSQR
jgi:hypothetical protein